MTLFPLLLGCSRAALPTVVLDVAGHEVRAEVADDAAERQRGLMYRDTLGADDGMVFVYAEAQERSFWMKDTRIPLTIAWIAPGGAIVGLNDLTPFDLDPVPSGAPAMYALEMNRGWFAAHGVRTGDVVRGLPAAPEP